MKTSIKNANIQKTVFKGISISTTKDGQGLKIADLGKARKVKFADDQDDE